MVMVFFHICNFWISIFFPICKVLCANGILILFLSDCRAQKAQWGTALFANFHIKWEYYNGVCRAFWVMLMIKSSQCPCSRFQSIVPASILHKLYLEMKKISCDWIKDVLGLKIDWCTHLSFEINRLKYTNHTYYNDDPASTELSNTVMKRNAIGVTLRPCGVTFCIIPA